MCLIAYVPAGRHMPEPYMQNAYEGNPDGIGIMSKDGVRKFYGRKMLKKARRYMRILHKMNAEYAVHFRFATHGSAGYENTHPFQTPNGEAFVMHNGVLHKYAEKIDPKCDDSDTAVFVRSLVDADFSDASYWEWVEREIGWGNKLCVMSWDGQFRLVNADAGTWRDGVWYSQTYSLSSPTWYKRWLDYDDAHSDATSVVLASSRYGTARYYDAASGREGSYPLYGPDAAIGETVKAALDRRYGPSRGYLTYDKDKGTATLTETPSADDEWESGNPWRGWGSQKDYYQIEADNLDKALEDKLRRDYPEAIGESLDDDCMLPNWSDPATKEGA